MDRLLPCSVAGELTLPDKGMVLIEGGRETKLEQNPIVDPFWNAFYGALSAP